MEPHAVEAERLNFVYRGSAEPALKEIDLNLDQGAVNFILGHSGCGKSSLCLTFNGLIPRFVRGQLSGTIRVMGREPSSFNITDAARTVGIVFQDFDSMLVASTAELEVALGPENCQVPRREIRRRVDDYLELLGLSHLRHAEPATLSGGQRQRLAIAAILALEPGVLALDEVMTDLDPVAQEEVIALAQTLRNRGSCVALTDLDAELSWGCDQVTVMKDGGIVVTAPPSNVLSEVSLLEECGVRPTNLAQLFRRLGLQDTPRTVENAVAVLTPMLTDARRIGSSTAPVPGDAILAARRVTFEYARDSRARALQETSVIIREGEFVAIVGENGSGKTTLAKLLSGLLKPFTGDVLLDGRSLNTISRREVAEGVGYVFQNPDHQIFASSVYDEVSFSLRNYAAPADLIRTRVGMALHAVGLTGSEEKDPFALTRGGRQRVAVASVLATRPRVVIMDEPTTGLDYGQQRNMMQMLASLHRQGHTIVIITHCMWAATDYAQRTIVMKGGRIMLDGHTANVFADEHTIRDARVVAPPAVQLSNRLRLNAVALDDIVGAIRSAVSPASLDLVRDGLVRPENSGFEN